jgi:lipopolysaccharide transport system ATP-binding protein
MHTIRSLCDRCIVLERGKIVFDGDVDRAIALYMGSGSPQLHRDCTALPREAICRGGVRIQEVTIHAQQPVVVDREPLQIRILLEAAETVPELLFRMILFSAGGSPVGMLTSNGFLPAKVGENRVKLTLDVTTLAPGEYTGRLVLYSVNGYGGEHIYDVVDPGLAFRKEWQNCADDTTQVWKSQVWGNVRFPAAEVEHEVD